MLCSACSSSDNPVDQEQEEDKYFFRYEVTCVSDSAQSIKKLYVITDNGNIITQMPEGKKNRVERYLWSCFKEMLYWIVMQ